MSGQGPRPIGKREFVKPVGLKSPISIPNHHEQSQFQPNLHPPPSSPIRFPQQHAVVPSRYKTELEEFALKLASELNHFEHWPLNHGDLYMSALDTYHKLENSEERCVRLEEDNKLLREQITITSTQEPIQEGYWFIRQFDLIGMEIESWVAKQTVETPAERIPKADREMLVRQISSWSETGRDAAEFIQGQLKDNYRGPKKKIRLIRHIIAIFLFEHVFDRFAFGLSSGESNYFKSLEMDIFHHGSFLPPLCP